MNQPIFCVTTVFLLFCIFSAGSTQAKSLSESETDQVCIRFIYPGDENLKNLGIEKEPLKFWSDTDRSKIQRQFDTLRPKISNFLHRKTDQSIQLGRVKGLTRRNTIAMTLPNAILLSDAYFFADPKEADKALLHELTHFSDCARYFSWSKQWIDFCDARKILVNSPDANPYSEALADFVSNVLSRESPEQEDLDFIRSLFSNSRQYEKWTLHMRAGFEKKALRDLKSAIVEFKAAAQLDNFSLMPRLQLMSCYFHRSLTDKALYESDLAMKIIHYLDLKICSMELAELLARRYVWLLEKRDSLKAENFYTEVTQKCPDKIPLFNRLQDEFRNNKTKSKIDNITSDP